MEAAVRLSAGEEVQEDDGRHHGVPGGGDQAHLAADQGPRGCAPSDGGAG